MRYILLTLINVLLNIILYGQQDIINNSQTVYVDSTIFYFNKAKTPNGIDTLVFEKGLRAISNIALDDNAIKRIQIKAKEFIGIEESRFYTRIELALYHAIFSSQQYYKAIDFGKEIISRYQATQNADERTLFLCMLEQMRIPFRLSDKLEDGFDYYTAQLKLYLQKNDSAAISACYYVHGGFYATKGLNDLSIYYYKKSILYLNENDTVKFLYSSGRSAWENNTAVVGKIYNDIGDYQSAILYSRSALRFGLKDKIGDSPKSYIYKNIAYAKIMLNELDSVIYFLNMAITSAEGSKQHIANCYLVKGIYYMQTNQLDSSEFYLNQCENLVEEEDMPANTVHGKLVPNYYLALVKMQQNRFKEAAALLNAEIPRLGNLREDLIKEYSLLVEVYLKLGDVKNATETFARCNTLREQLQADERSNRQMSFETEQKIAEAEGTITNLETEKQVASLTRNYLVGIVSLLLVIALFIYNRFRVKRSANVKLEEKNKIILLEKANVEKEKERSDNLLLNILPAEVAEELKQKGTADAKQFDQVTVMFTDFKDFSKISEKLSPAELVAEIHTCFKAFDEIIGRHNIEKIKTIGDSYMCVGGLPVSNSTHAYDVVNAAIEIQEFILRHLEVKKMQGKEIFEIRIGVHTGPVIAGIVGVKKFAYDIWGDTVNTASRMESSGEVGKVNISDTTYELVKDKFTCTHRGKIMAKNMGEIDMFFVEGRI